MNLIFVLIALLVGLALGVAGRILWGMQKAKTAESRADHIVADAKAKEKEMLLNAKDQALKIIEEAKREEESRRRDISAQQQRLEKREEMFDKKILELEDRQSKLAQSQQKIDELKQDIERVKQEQLAKLERVANLPQQEARQLLIDHTESAMKEELLQRVRKLQEQGAEDLQAKATNMLAAVMERCASSHAVETTTTAVQLSSDEMKGRIIGKEGRNIKALEQITGVEIVVDETPGTILVSGFSSIRRQVAKLALEKLLHDGRIHPGRIEEAVDAAKKDLAIDIKKAGEEAAYEVGVVGLDTKLVQILGRLKYRTSYGHNILRHSIEVGLLSGMLAEELGANVSVAKKGGLLHDIGKAVDHEMQGAHTDLGREIMRKFGLPEEIAYIAVAHHEDHPQSLEGLIVKIADAISGARPGARKDTFENYVQRLDELEKTASSFDGVEKVYAIQAGREIRVFVKPEMVDDWIAQKLARDIANKIEQELKYPGEIKVMVIRETRIIEYAR